MTRALFKKQMMEVFAWLYCNRKTGKNRSRAATILLGTAYSILIFGVLGGVFYSVASSICQPLMQAGLGWMYWSIMGLISVAMGAFGSVFNTYSSLYQAKDNDLLLSMPIPIPRIMAVRLMGVYIMGLIYELVVIVPALIVWFVNGGSPWALQLPVALSFLVLSISCILGWVVALIASKVRSKNVITVALSLAFICGYYYVYMNAYNMLMSLLANPMSVSVKIKGILYPFYHMGLGAAGNIASVLIFAAMVAALFAAVYAVLSRSFICIATANKGAKKARYRAREVRASSPDGALLRKELARFLGSANYMLNCGIGVVIMIIGAVALVIFKNSVFSAIFAMFAGSNDLIPMLATAALCMMATTCNISAPSVSLEGKNIWLAQSLPISAVQALMAKLKLHLLLTLPPSALLTAAMLWVLHPAWYFCLLTPVVVVSFDIFMALTGLSANLRMPNLNWTSEIVPIKQGASVAIALLGSWAVVLALGGLYALLAPRVSPVLYLVLVTALLLALSAVMLRWVRTKGAHIFETL